ncbi:MAG TPA: phosphatidate cytidylyltransferase [Bacillota bacterium]|nr:phosphatidate cytidylyltransferase [Bacillota bacterium]HUM56309.1 phosphatidate cytidylyltransferase [Bacillota bacterium]
MKTRIISGLIMLPMLAVLYFGGYVLMAACFGLTLAALYEFFKGFHSMGVKPSYPVASVSVMLLYGYTLYLNLSGGNVIDLSGPFMFWVFITLTASLIYLFRIEKRQLQDAMATVTGVLYIAFFAFHLVLVDQTGEPSILIWIIIFSAFGTDVFAYFTGLALGRHKLCPSISPKKTVEGAVGGVIGSIIICGAFGYFFAEEYLSHCLILGIMGGIISQLGDLTASVFKRKMGIKDYGHLIPGHGGILDRFDSVLFTAPMVYYYIIFVIQ